jgi:hypothetical protein|tara:strand:- start:340 stop:579 length:240 start_codon:yes stop_codon:yes gene_type:complete
MEKLSTVMQKVEELALSEIRSEKDYLQVCGALMAVTRNMYEKALGPEQTQQMFIAVAESFNFQEEVIRMFKPVEKPTLH